jgi:hypothetical protein
MTEIRGSLSLDELRELRRAERAPAELRQSLAERLQRELARSPGAADDARSVAAQLDAPYYPQPVYPQPIYRQPILALQPFSARQPEHAAQPEQAAFGAGKRRARSLEPRSLALGFAAAALLFSLPRWWRGAAPEAPAPAQLAFAPEPVEARLRPAIASREMPLPAAQAPAPLVSEERNELAERRVSQEREPEPPAVAAVSASPVRDAPAAAAPLPTFSEETNAALAPVLDLLSERPALNVVIPGFAPTAVASVSDSGLPRALGPNLITNGDFSQGTALWQVRRWDPSGPPPSALAPFDVVDGALCTTIRGGDFVVAGWPWDDRSLAPNSFELERGQRYRLSLRAWSRGPWPVALIAKVGHRSNPYTPAQQATVPVTQVPHVFSVAFEPHADDDEAGLAFAASAIHSSGSRVGASELCIDDVRVTREAGKWR